MYVHNTRSFTVEFGIYASKIYNFKTVSTENNYFIQIFIPPPKKKSILKGMDMQLGK